MKHAILINVLLFGCWGDDRDETITRETVGVAGQGEAITGHFYNCKCLICAYGMQIDDVCATDTADTVSKAPKRCDRYVSAPSPEVLAKPCACETERVRCLL